jgi:hypothetical protein
VKEELTANEGKVRLGILKLRRLPLALALSCLVHLAALLALEYFMASNRLRGLKDRAQRPQQSISIRLLTGPAQSVQEESSSPKAITDGAKVVPKRRPQIESAIGTKTEGRSNASSDAPVHHTSRGSQSPTSIGDTPVNPDEVNDAAAIQSQSEKSALVAEPLAPVDIKSFGRSYGRYLEQDAQKQFDARVTGRQMEASSGMRTAFEKHLKSIGSSWTEYKANDGSSWVRFSGGGCVKIPEFDHREHRQLNKTVTLTDCPNS